MRNPYVGPEPLSKNHTIFGRSREIRELYHLLTAERVVLLHSPSGAGKSSLISAREGLLDRMREDFDVWPVARVNKRPPAEIRGRNRYVWSVVNTLRPGEEFDAPRMADALRPPPSETVLVIFDQFEESLTLDPADVDEKRDFFRQLGELLAFPNIWALLVLREDYLAPLDPYRRLLPTHLRNRYRLDLLSRANARDAIAGPAAEAGREFTPEALDLLIGDLAQIQVQQPDGTFAPQKGPYVEPMQLQVACERLWERLRLSPEETRIQPAHVQSYGNVTVALSDYYAEAVGKVAAHSAVPERDIREWFERSLLNAAGVRRQVLEGPGNSEGLPNTAVAALEKAHLIRRERRNEAVWYELAHDRLIAPVRSNNSEWFASNLSPLQLQADAWVRGGKAAALLASSKQLRRWKALTLQATRDTETEFLKASEQNARAERLRAAAPFAAIVVLALAAVALFFAYSARRQSAIALSRQLAVSAKNLAAANKRVPAVMVALNALDRQWTEEAEEALHQAVQAADALQFRGHEDGATVALFPPNESGRLLTGGSDGNVFEWDVERGAEKRDVNVGAHIVDLALDRAGALLAVATTEGVRLLDLRTLQGRPLAADGCKPVASVAFSKTGRWLAAACWEKDVSVFDMRTGTLHGRIATAKRVRDIAFGADENTLAAAGDGNGVTLHDIAGTQPIIAAYEHRDAVYSVAFSPDARLLASVGNDGALAVWDVAERKRRYVVDAHAGGAWSVTFSADGRMLATGGASDGAVRIWDVETGTPKLALWGHNGKLLSLAFAPSGARLVTVDDNDKRVRKFDLDNNNLRGRARQIIVRAEWKLTPADCEQYLRLSTCPTW